MSFVIKVCNMTYSATTEARLNPIPSCRIYGGQNDVGTDFYFCTSRCPTLCHSFNPVYSLPHLLIHSFIYIFFRSFVHSFIHYPLRYIIFTKHDLKIVHV